MLEVRLLEPAPLRAAHAFARVRQLLNRRSLRQTQEPGGVKKVFSRQHLTPDRRRQVRTLHAASFVRARIVQPEQADDRMYAPREVTARGQRLELGGPGGAVHVSSV